ncbi:hypothetical protein AYI68_g994 [Smittium mucronatum]|uniref:Transmembrane protein 198 n=1 Tax=Smittium mucronatum TaxID=133383 RepID=A0A1R0H6S2_9FUNG|nr:hypothetical protein AYI68_g994 [Smittium mucronatum]
MSLLHLLFYFLFSALTNAQNISINGSNDIIFSKGTVDASGIVAGIILIVFGFIFTFFGRKLVKVLIFLAGVCFVGIFVLYAEYKIRAPQDGESTRTLIYFIVALAIGCIGGFVCLFLYKVGIFLVGALGGFALANFILTFSSSGIFSQTYARIIFIVVLAAIGGVITLFIERPAIIIGSSAYGSYISFVGIDCFARTGFKESILLVVYGSQSIKGRPAGVYGMLAGTVVLAIMGMLVQFKTTKN